MSRVTFNYEAGLGSGVFLKLLASPDLETFRDSSNRANRAAANQAPLPVSVYASADRSSIGVHARGVFIRFLNQESPPGFTDQKAFVPIFRPFFYSRLLLGETCRYRGEPVMIVGLRPQISRG